MAPQVRFCVLGPMRAWRDDIEVDLGSPQQQAVLAMLLLREGRLTLSSELISAIWGADPPRAAAGTVRTYISRLRRSLESGVDSAVRIDSFGGGYALEVDPAALDHTLFHLHISRAREARKNADPAAVDESLREAIALVRGTPLAGVPGPYAEIQRSAILQALLSARAHRLAATLELGQHSEAVAELSTLTTEYPLREQFRELLMLALYRSGRQADALAVFQSVRRRLADDLGIDPGPRLQSLHQRILDNDPNLFQLTTIRAPSRSSTFTTWLTPRQLPADLADFTGRDRVLAEITEALTRPDAVPVVAIAGMGGVGKTALAVHAAHGVRDHFPDGQVFVQLDALGDSPAEPRDVLANLLRTFRPIAEPLPETLGERAALWRTMLSGRRVLIVLDDAAHSAQVQHLLPATPGCAVLVTGRRRLMDLPGSDWITLDVFEPDEALTLLGRMAGHDRVAAEPRAARNLVAACSHIPHAVRCGGARLIARPDWSIADFERRVTEEMSQLTKHYEDSLAITDPFARGFQQLDAEQVRAFRLLAVPDGQEISTAAAAAMLELPEAVAETLLESLANVHLIEAGVRGRYRYHGLVRWFARHRAFIEDGGPAGLAALGRLLRFYHATARNSLMPLDTLTFAPRSPEPGEGLTFATRREAAAWLLLERDNISATARQAAAQATMLSPEAVHALRRLTPLVRRFDIDASHPSSREIYDLLAPPRSAQPVFVGCSPG